MNPIKLIPLHGNRKEAWAKGTENCSVHLTYDMSNQLNAWPDAVPSVAFERADGEKYPHAWELDGAVLHIPLMLADTEVPGTCKCMITLTQGEGRSNTEIFYGVVTRGIDSLGEEPEEPMLGVIEQVNQAAADAHTAKVGAEAAQKEAKDSADLASGYKDDVAADAEVTGIYRDEAREYAASAINARIYAERAKDDALASKEAAATSEENAVNAANAAAEHAQSAKENAEEAKSEAANAKSEADNAMAHAKAAEEALSNMEERYYIPGVSEDGKLVFTPNADGMPEVPPMDIRGESDIFVITVDTTRGTTNKTVSEISKAIADGKAPVVYDTHSNCVYVMSHNFVTSFEFDYLFSVLGSSAKHEFMLYRITINSDNTITYKAFTNFAIPNPNKLTFTGAASGEYDGSSPLTIDIPEGGGGGGESPRETLTFTGAVEATYDGSTAVNVEIPESTVFAVHTWYDSTDKKYKADKTSTEILEAMGDGAVPVAIHNDKIVHQLSYAGNGYVRFVNYSVTADSEFSEQLITINGSIVTVSSTSKTFKNPNAITFTGAVDATYDGSSAVTINIPSGGAGGAGDFFVVTVERENPDVGSGKVFADKTYSEIKGALDSGLIPVLVEKGTGIIYTIRKVEKSGIKFHSPINNFFFVDSSEFFIIDFLSYKDPEWAFEMFYSETPETLYFEGYEDGYFKGNLEKRIFIPYSEITDIQSGKRLSVTTREGTKHIDIVSGAADWNASEGENGYVANRTHWVERGKGEGEVIYDKIQLQLVEEMGGLVVFHEPKRSFIDGEELKVTVSGVEFECKAVKYYDPDSGMDAFVIGNAGAIIPDVEPNELPFVFVMLATPEDMGDGIKAYGMGMILGDIEGNDGNGFTLSIVAKSDLYHKLDYRYVGTKYPQPDWGGTGSEVVLPETVIEIDFGLDEPIGYVYQKFSVEDGKKYTVTYNGAKYVSTAVYVGEEGFALGNIGAATGSGDTGEPFLMQILPSDEMASEFGFYGMIVPLDGAESVTLSIETDGGVHRIPSKFLGDYEQPAWGKVDGAGVIYQAAEGTIQTLQSYKQYAITVPVNIEVGKKYNVRFNGVDYEAVASSQTIGLETRPVIGDMGLVEASATEGDPPFLVVGGTTLFPQFESGSVYALLNTVKGTEPEEFVISEFSGIKKIPVEYIDTPPNIVLTQHKYDNPEYAGTGITPDPNDGYSNIAQMEIVKHAKGGGLGSCLMRLFYGGEKHNVYVHRFDVGEGSNVEFFAEFISNNQTVKVSCYVEKNGISFRF